MNPDLFLGLWPFPLDQCGFKYVCVRYLFIFKFYKITASAEGWSRDEKLWSCKKKLSTVRGFLCGYMVYVGCYYDGLLAVFLIILPNVQIFSYFFLQTNLNVFELENIQNRIDFSKNKRDRKLPRSAYLCLCIIHSERRNRMLCYDFQPGGVIVKGPMTHLCVFHSSKS